MTYNKTTDENGSASTLTAYNPVTGEQRGFNILVRPLIETSDLTKYYHNGSSFVAKVYNEDGTLANNTNITY